MTNIQLTANHFKIRKQQKLELDLAETIAIIERCINMSFEKENFQKIEATINFLDEKIKPIIIDNFESRGFKVDFINKDKAPPFETTVVLIVE